MTDRGRPAWEFVDRHMTLEDRSCTCNDISGHRAFFGSLCSWVSDANWTSTATVFIATSVNIWVACIQSGLLIATVRVLSAP